MNDGSGDRGVEKKGKGGGGGESGRGKTLGNQRGVLQLRLDTNKGRKKGGKDSDMLKNIASEKEESLRGPTDDYLKLHT